MNTTVALLISLLLLILNGFFVAAEFSLVASKRHRLEQFAADGSRSARAASPVASRICSGSMVPASSAFTTAWPRKWLFVITYASFVRAAISLIRVIHGSNSSSE